MLRSNIRFKSLFRNFKILLSIMLAGVGMELSVTPASAAERVILKYRVLRESIPVSDLRTLVDTGEAPSSLKNYLKIADTEPDELQRVLKKEVEVDPVQLSKILNSPVGEFFLDRASEIVHTPSERASRQSLRGALVVSAVPDNQIQIIEVLENYPTYEIHVDGDRLVELYNVINHVARRLDDLEIKL
ncbi:alpha/beta hydrolase [Hydrococcus rivularis NIES-593]|uniref:Alpha/beta hydrolase n=1 Tax=Hydrococcus rivularis NIES-593 TaxID=1921803 RepID=A0A1U7HHD0_9CYAN|nr:alpha/beta hydrolase [Hydrococcus rivularis NIES-593]